jgi:hypothetical protein
MFLKLQMMCVSCRCLIVDIVVQLLSIYIATTVQITSCWQFTPAAHDVWQLQLRELISRICCYACNGKVRAEHQSQLKVSKGGEVGRQR